MVLPLIGKGCVDAYLNILSIMKTHKNNVAILEGKCMVSIGKKKIEHAWGKKMEHGTFNAHTKWVGNGENKI